MIIQWVGPWQFPASYSGLGTVAEAAGEYYGGKLYADWSGLYAGWHLLTGSWNFTAVVQIEVIVEEDDGFSGAYVRERRRQKREREKLELAAKRKITAIVDQELAAILLWMM